MAGGEKDRGAYRVIEARIAALMAARRFEDAYLYIIEALGPGVHGYLRGMTGSAVQGDDIYQALRVTLWENLPGLAAYVGQEGREGTVRAWLYRIARNRAIDWLRRCSRDNVPLGTGVEFVSPAMGQSSAVQHKEQVELVDRVLGELTEVERDAFVLRAERGLSFKEIGEVLGVADTVARERFHRARERIKRLLGPVLAE